LPATAVKHVVIVVQENRTPDNLFGADTALAQSGANLASSGMCHNAPVTLEPYELDACFDPNHQHAQGWEAMWDGGKLDGACDVRIAKESCIPVSPPPPYPNYTYVANTKYDGVHGILDPYFQIAGAYGFANYMFQTNQGPSFPAHQFLFGGTSAPDYFGDPKGQSCTDLQGNSYPCWQWFAAENPGGDSNGSAGCTATSVVDDIDPLGYEAAAYNKGLPCYTHNTLTTLLEQAGVTWRYYTSPHPYLLWTAPNAISSICDPVVGGQCTGTDWTQHVVLADTGSYAGDYAPVLTDISNCALQSVSWVTPDGTWSDHPGTGSPTQPSDGGPSWASAIVNAIGTASTCDGGAGYWSDTVILITWDDWGGWFDHVSPAASAGGPGIGYSNQSATEYVYGFRVPLLVVSTYARQAYISGPSSGPSCATDHYYCHDFGSILGFVEYVAGLGSISPSYEYADFLAPDSTSSGCSHTVCPFPLADFFTSTKSPFTSISPGKYQPKCFHNPNQPGCWPNFVPEDPDNDADDD